MDGRILTVAMAAALWLAGGVCQGTAASPFAQKGSQLAQKTETGTHKRTAHARRPPANGAHEEVAGDGADYAGLWTGRWEGAGIGHVELTVERNSDGAFAGRVAVNGEEPSYKTYLHTLKFDGSKMVATYTFPPDDAVEIEMTGTFEGHTAKGTWTARTKSSDAPFATGAWKLTKKERESSTAR